MGKRCCLVMRGSKARNDGLTSPSMNLPKKTLLMNCALPSAASRLCAAKEKLTKFRSEPETKKKVPTNQIGGFFTVSFCWDEEDEVEGDEEEFEAARAMASSRRLWPCFYVARVCARVLDEAGRWG